MNDRTPRPPVPPRDDPQGWMEDPHSPDMVAHLSDERARADAALDGARVRPDTLYREMRARLPETEQQVPTPWGPYLYYARYAAGLAHPLHVRRPKDGGPEQLLLDENALEDVRPGTSVVALSVSPDHHHLLFALDSGDERCTLHVKNLSSGRLLPESIADAAAEVAWTDGGAFLYLRLDAANRPATAHRHRLGTEVAGDATVFREADPAFHLSLRRGESGRFVFLTAQSLQTTEVWCLPCQDGATAPLPVSPRVPGREVYATDRGDHLYLLTNEDAPNFKLVRRPLPDAAPGTAGGVEETVVPHQPAVRLRHVQAFARHLVLHQRVAGVPQIRILGEDGPHTVAMPEAFHALHPGDNRDYASAVLRFGYDSFTTPYRVYDYDMDRRALTLREATAVPGYDPALYATARLSVPAGDGASIPVSLVFRRGNGDPDRPKPLVLYAYGAYGHSVDTEFSAARLSLLDRGIVFAVAHVRGGGELGKAWHMAGCRRNKPRAVADLIACAEYLIGLRLTAADRLGLMGQSAGGLIVTAAMNKRPDLFAAVVGDVPFVDPIATLSDSDLPYTALDREEWGNPENPGDLAVLKSYAPCDTVRRAAYPAVLLTAGLHDVRVDCREPVKLAGRLRAATTSGRPVLLRPRLDAGHEGPLGRYDELREWAFMHAFLIDTLCPSPETNP